MKEDNANFLELFLELEGAEKNGIPLKLDGYPSSPLQIAQTCTVREENNYMRDYLTNEEGMIHEIRFDKVKDY